MTSFTVNKTEIIDALSKITGIVESRTSVPILSNIAIVADKKSITISATDMDINATISCPATVSKAGDFTISARQFFEICKKSPDELIEASATDVKATIKSGRSKFNLGTLPIGEFPVFDINPDAGFSIDSNFMLKLIDDVVTSISDNEATYYLMGIFFHEIDGKFTSVATTGHVLSQSHGDAVGEFPEAIIPRKTIAVLQKLLGAYEGDIKVLFIENKVQFTIGNLVLSSKLIDGKFPDYKRIVPSTYKGSFGIDTATALASIDRLCTIEDKVSNSIKMTVAGNIVTFDRTGTDENASDQIDCEYTGEDFTVHLNSKYLSDALGNIKTGKTVVQFIDATSPLLFTAENDDLASWLIMPTRGRTS